MTEPIDHRAVLANYCDARTASSILTVGRSTLHYLVKRGALTAYPLGGQRVFVVAEVKAYAAARATVRGGAR